MLVGHILDIYKIPLQQTCTELQGADVMDDVKLRMMLGKRAARGGLQRLCSSIIGYLVPERMLKFFN